MASVIAGGKSVLVANLAGKYYATGNVCTHMGCTLSNGTLKEGNVECPCHGSVFDVKTGKVVKGPAKKPEPTFQVKVEGDDLMISV
jgi:3-phenylpropionate/trans-cinnamate dioxygenase ferredoxin subunit